MFIQTNHSHFQFWAGNDVERSFMRRIGTNHAGLLVMRHDKDHLYFEPVDEIVVRFRKDDNHEK